VKEIRIHARAGQGAITVANLLGAAAVAEGMYALAFPHFGAARMGAPMNAFVRVSDKPIRLRCQIYEPDCLIVVDPTLLVGYDVFAGLKPGGIAVVNRPSAEGVTAPAGAKVVCVPATEIATEVIGRPFANTTLLGAFAAATGLISVAAVEKVIAEHFEERLAKTNAEAARRGYQFVKAHEK
jgi:pyruvate ferredoxin oxidoreductase gamma subunit